MRQFFKFFFASLLAMIIASILFFAALFAFVGFVGDSISNSFETTQPAITKDNSILYIDLRQHYQELGQKNTLAVFTGGPQFIPGLNDVLNSIKFAKSDSRIKGIYLKCGGSNNGLATEQQIRNALNDFKESGKFIYAYGEYLTQADYFVASIADSVFLNPLGSVELKGLASQITFFKGAMDKLEIKPEIFYCGQFKSATEPFRMKQMSNPNRKQIAVLQHDIWVQYLLAFQNHSGVDTSEINSWAQNGTIQTAYNALQAHLVDGIKYKDQVEKLLRIKSGILDDRDVQFVDVNNYAQNIPRHNSKNEIALLVGEGPIVGGEGSGGNTQIASEAFIKAIRKVKNDDNIKAVVMRINSPGGSAIASEVILRELYLLKKEKPLVVSMGDLAASGGYYISCQADSIFALPTTITGSIGVFGMMFNVQPFFNNKLGITFDVEKNAPYADYPNMKRPMTAQEKTFMQNGVDSIYLTFKRRVAKGRNLSLAYVDSIGQGRVWSGTAGVRIGLVDAIGGLDRAFKSAASLAKIDDYQIVTFPERSGKLEQLFKMFKDNKVSEQLIAQKLLEQQLGNDYYWFNMLRTLKAEKNQLWMMMPFIPEIK